MSFIFLIEMMTFNSVFRTWSDSSTSFIKTLDNTLFQCFIPKQRHIAVSAEIMVELEQNVSMATTFMEYPTWNPGFMRENRETRFLANLRHLPLFLNLFM